MCRPVSESPQAQRSESLSPSLKRLTVDEQRMLKAGSDEATQAHQSRGEDRDFLSYRLNVRDENKARVEHHSRIPVFPGPSDGGVSNGGRAGSKEPFKSTAEDLVGERRRKLSPSH
ncbi:hypothetical protein HHI36_006885 [Cryptolaemus montrouzieri]|uniref:Uncharacterized protein n=1 Tax=Cryptolaemus montrouzieri TaxID=559131 RepID=A0ABD2MN68_9CUCU